MTEPETDAATTVRVTVGRRGGDEVARAAREAAPAGVSVQRVGPTGLTWQEPILAATRDGRTAVYGRVTPTGAKGLIDAVADELLEPPAIAVGTVGDDEVPRAADGPLAVGERRALARCGWVDPTDGSPVGGTGAAEVEAVARESGFRGRGRGDDADGPVVESWDAVSELAKRGESAGEPVVVVNGNDADPGADADRLLLESDPAAVLDGATAVAGVVGATDIAVLVAEGDEIARTRVRAVAADADRNVTVVAGPGTFDAGDPERAVESVAELSAAEFDGRPAVVHTPRTLAGLRSLARSDGSTVGTATDPGTRLITVRGDADRATIELPTDAPIADVLGAIEDPAFEFACVGGRLGGLTESLDVPANADALPAAGLGTDGVVELYDESRCPVAVAGKRTKFAREHGCGRCDACREVVPELHERLRAVYDGEFDPDELRDLCATLAEANCSFATAAARPARSALDGFEAAFRAHAEGRCPAGECY